MGETKWTKEQQSAIETRNCNLLVAAAAGSGKTAVLVERIIRIITNEDNPIDIDKLLVVTFTNAAAAEMRERIAAAISKALDENPNSKNLQKQLTLLNRANITTMHSFCLDVIKNNFHKIDLDPSFRIGDQTEGILIKAEVIDELFEEKYDNDDEGFLKLVEAYSNYKSDDNLKELILDLYNFTMSGPWPEKWINESIEEFNVANLEELGNTKWVKVLRESIKIELQGYLRMLDQAIRIIKDTDGLDPYLSNFEDDISSIKNAYEKASEGFEEMYNSLIKISFGRLSTIKKNTVSDVDAQNRVKQIRDDIKKKIKDLTQSTFAVTPDEMLLNIQGAYPYVKELGAVVLEFGEKFSKKKKEKNILDFNDLEHFCLKILSEKDEENNIVPSKVAQNFKEYFDEVLVDEYQDSNNVQETIINLVSRRNDSEPNVFMVGDVKQSIYRFRQAKPELFIKKYNTYDLEKGDNRKIQLFKNFRSRREVIDGVNYIFKEIMSTTVGELEYTDEEALNLGAGYLENDESSNIILGGPIEVNIIDKKSEISKAKAEDNDSENEADKDAEEKEELESVNLEGRVIAKRIKELMSTKGDKTFNVLDKETGKYRNLKYKDIVILLRATKNWAENLLEELGKEGIPAYADTGSGYFESIEIRTILALLKVIDNPMQDVPLVAILRSPIMSFSAEELSDIRLLNKTDYFYTNIERIANEEDIAGDFSDYKELKRKCTNFLENLNKWREKSIYMPIDEFIWYLYMDTAYYGYVGAMPNGVLRQANLKILFQRAKQFEQTSFKGLFNFINFINKLTKSSGDMGSAKILGENEDVVRIMSIHKSKGLEFPVVFLCGTGKQFNLMDLNKSMLYHDELGLGPDFVDLEKRLSISTIAKDSIKKKMKLETLSEEVRILYVALTRAKEKLIITGSVNDVGKSIEKWVNAASLDHNLILPSEVIKAKTYLDWIGMSLCQHNDGAVLREMNAINNEIAKDDDSKWKINIYDKNTLSEENEEEDTKEEQDKNESNVLKEDNYNKKVFDEIEKRLSYRYPLSESTKLKSNISVSDLKRKNEENEFEVENIFENEEKKKERTIITPKFLKEEKGLTGAERGTAVHFVMKKLDFDRVSTVDEIRKQIQELYEGEFLLEEEVKAVNPYKILSFCNSDLGRMIIELHKEGKKIYREVPFYTEISSLEIDKNLDKKYKNEMVRLQGIIDCFFEYKGEIILLDYKTDYIEKNNEEELVSRYKKQLDYYSDAIFKMTNKKVSKRYLYSFYLENVIEV